MRYLIKTTKRYYLTQNNMHLWVYVADFSKMQKVQTIIDTLLKSFSPANHKTLGRKGKIQKQPGDKRIKDLKFLFLDAQKCRCLCYAL